LLKNQQKDPELVKKAVDQNVLAVQYADFQLRNNKEFMVYVVGKDPACLQYASETMKVKRGRVYEEVKEGNYKENGNWGLDNI
jgi:hypothetical protein